MLRTRRYGESFESHAFPLIGQNQPLELRLPIWLVHNETGFPDRSLRQLAEKLQQPSFGLAMPENCSELHCMDGLAKAHLKCVKRLQPVGPYVFVGCSVLGSLLAATMTTHLER